MAPLGELRRESCGLDLGASDVEGLDHEDDAPRSPAAGGGTRRTIDRHDAFRVSHALEHQDAPRDVAHVLARHQLVEHRARGHGIEGVGAARNRST